MPISTMQLVARGKENIYYKSNYNIFKATYRRHTNFAMEDIPQYFPNNTNVSQPNFGRTVSCELTVSGDLLNKSAIVTTLPRLNPCGNILYAWKENIAFSLINYVEVVINNNVIDKHYGEWLFLWHDLTGNKNGYWNELFGNVPELLSFTPCKDEYQVYIPLQFWFCQSLGLSIPLVSLPFSKIFLNIEFNRIEDCLVIGPTHSIKCCNDIVNFKPFERIQQVINNTIVDGIFISYNILCKSLNYIKFHDKFEYVCNNMFPNTIVGTTSGFCANIENCAQSIIITDYNRLTRDLMLKKTYILCTYVFLDKEERIKFAKMSHDYLIETLYFTESPKLEQFDNSVYVNIENSCKLMIWVASLCKRFNNYDYTACNHSLIECSNIYLNGNELMTLRSYKYFNYIIPYEYFPNGIQEGICVYPFAVNPTKYQPTGTMNMTPITTIQIKAKLNKCVNKCNPATLRCYALSYNIFRVAYGVCALVYVT